jgi:hypothetical protein
MLPGGFCCVRGLLCTSEAEIGRFHAKDDKDAKNQAIVTNWEQREYFDCSDLCDKAVPARTSSAAKTLRAML